MKTKYEFRKKALEFAKKDEVKYDSVKAEGLYGNYEVYTPYCKNWKNNPPMIGMPQVILVNENEVKWGNPKDPLSILHACKKIPSVVFEYECYYHFGTSFNIKLYSDGTLLKDEFGSFKAIPENQLNNDSDNVLLVNQDLVQNIKSFIKDNREVLKSLPKKIDNIYILDGADETVKLGKFRFTGCNMFTVDMEERVEFYKTHDIPPEESFVIPLYELQKIFKKIKSVICKYYPNEDIWD